MGEGLLRINVGCGQTPVPGWLNVDNSLTVLVSRWKRVCSLLEGLGVLNDEQKAFMRVAREKGIRWANALRLPAASESADVVYASHMLEHLDRKEAERFLSEAYRVLISGGILRLVVPDLRKLVDEYILTGDADRFVARTLLARSRPRTITQIIKWFAVGDRHHLWLYDGESLKRMVLKAGFRDAWILDPGVTRIPNPGVLDLRERAEESVYVEAMK